MKKFKGIFTLLVTALLALCLFSFSSSAADEGKWIKAWGTAPAEVGTELLGIPVQKVAVRTVVRPTASGEKMRVKFSNVYGKEPLVINRATVAVSTGKSYIDTSTTKYLTVDNSLTFEIPAGGEVYSDEIKFNTVQGEEIAISVFVSEFMQIRTAGFTGGQTYLVTEFEGDGLGLVEKESFNPFADIEISDSGLTLDQLLGIIPGVSEIEKRIFKDYVPIITDVEVLNPDNEAYSVVVMGDSTVANDYPQYLAEILKEKNISSVGISSKGLSGSCLINDGLGYSTFIDGESVINRMKRDILGVDGQNSANVKYVILKVGANDIIRPVSLNVSGMKQPTADELMAAYEKVFDFCHKNGIKVIVSGITPWYGYTGTGTGPVYDRETEEYEKDWQIALDVNGKLSKNAKHDGYISFSDLSEFPDVLTDSVDGLNPSPILQRKWAQNTKLSLLGIGDTTRPEGIGIYPGSGVEIYRGASAVFTAKVNPSTANQKVIWSSSDPKVASIENGKVYAKAKGTAVITVTTADKGYNGKSFTASCKVTVRVKPESVKISASKSTIYTTQTLTLKATVSPSDSDFKTVKWTSSNTKVATVSSKGVVTATGKGSAVITATSTKDSKIKATYKITVKPKVQVQAIYLNYDERSRYVGTSFTLKPSVSPSNATYKDVTWKSSNSKIVKVDKNGKVTAIKPGIAAITCKSVDNPGVTAACIVTVKIKTEGVNLPTSKLTLYVSQSKTLKASVLPSNATDKGVTWSSSNTKIATVSKSGKITAKKPGTVTITVKTKSGGYKDTCKLTVKKFVKLKSFRLNKSSVSINNGKTYTLKPTFSPSNASNKTLSWKSSNKSVATVSSQGVVKGIKPGTAVISCYSKATGKTVKCTVKVKSVKVKTVLFGESTYTVKHNKTLQLKALISPTNATNKKIKWESSHPDFVKVSSSGKVTGLRLGKDSIITATTVDGKHVASCRVKVAKVSVTGIKLNKSIASVYTGGTVTLTPTLSPSKPSNSKVSWSSSDTKLATVSSDGVVKALKAGTVEITCKTSDGGYKAKCTVVIEQGIRVTKVTLDKTAEEADVGAVFNLFATVEPYNASNKKIIWSSTNTSVATVSANGKVTTLKPGLTYIRATTEDGRKVASCRLTVV